MSEKWEKDFRTALKLKVGKGWNVVNSRGIVRLLVGQKPNIVTLSTHYKWSEDAWIDALNRVVVINEIYKESKGKIDLKTAYAIASSASSTATYNWAEALDSYKLFKTIYNCLMLPPSCKLQYWKQMTLWRRRFLNLSFLLTLYIYRE